MKFKDLSITYHTDKVRECVDFYTRYLGATLSFDAGWYVSVHFQSDVNPYIYLSFQDASRFDHGTSVGGTSLNLLVDDVDACYQQLKQAGVTFSEEITDHEWGDRAFSVLDPIGNIVYIFSPRPFDDKYKDAIKE